MATVVIIAGTAGTGKSTIGVRIQNYYNTVYIEGDDVHPKENIDKMANRIPLTDEDRWGWLEKISRISTETALASQTRIAVASCSALKKAYREKIQEESPGTKFIYIFLYASMEVLLKRTEARKGHYMKPSMVQSQFDILELPKDEANALILDVSSKSIDQATDEAITYIDSNRN